MKEHHRSYNRRKPEKIQACTGFEGLTSAIPVQRSTNWANKPAESRSLNWLVLNLLKDDNDDHHIPFKV